MTQLLGADWKKDLENATLTTAPASDAEALAKTKTDVAVTPGNLAALGSTATFAGFVELATNAEALTGTDTARATTPANVAHVIGKLMPISFAGHDGAGACTATGLKIGDVVLGVTDITSGGEGNVSSDFESTITVDDQIQQSGSSDNSTETLLALVLRKS